MPEREIAENTAAGQNVGAPVTATDADAGDTLSYTLGGADVVSFDFVETTGQIRTKTNVSYDFEAKSSYTVTVTASDGTATAVASVTIRVTDVDEPPSAPATPMVSAVSGSTTSLSVSWAAPANAGKPAIASYDVQYRVGSSGTWSDGPEDVATTTATITSLVANTLYEARVRATNAEGDSDWSDPPGSGQTNLSTNTAPTAADKTVTTTLNRNYTFLTTDFGFEDADSGAALASVKIVTLPAVGNLALDGTDVTLNQVVTRAEIDAANLKFEPATDASGTGYASFDFKVNDGTDDSVSAYTMTIDVANVTAPGAPTALTATASGQAWIELAWTAPVHAGGRAITGYRIEVSLDGSSSWSELVLVATTTRSTATTYVHKGLNAGATRHYRVSAINVVGASDPSGSDHASTRTDEQLVSNFDYFGTADNIHLATQNVVGIFTTGSRDAKLNSIELKLGKFNNRTVAPELKLYVLNLNSSGRATLGEQVATLATPTTSLPRHSFRTFNYEAPSGTRLSASEEYIFVLEPPTIGIILVETTTDPSEDDVKADGWTIDGSGGGLEPFYIGSTRQIVFRVNGTQTPNTAPTAADNTVTMAEDGRYEFSATDFGFHDTNPADRLVSVRIETLPALGALALDRADVTLNQVVTKTQIDAGDLTFRPAAGGSGNNYARFNFKVNDGTVFSASAYTMRIDVTPTPPLTGQIFVDNTAETDYLRTVADNRSSQSFTTGPNRGGYILTSIGVVAQIVGENGVDDFSVAVHNADANGAPVALHTSLIPPGNFPEEVSTIHFHAPSNTRLRPNTTYSIVLGSGRTPSRFRQISATQSNADNASGSGWSIGDALHSRRSAASPWSSPNDGRSVKIVIRGNTASGVANNAPVFSPATVDRSIAENTAAGRNVGAVVTATDADNDPLTYTLGGADMASFDIDEFSGQIRTKAGVSYDHEAKPSYTVTVTASDGIATADADVTISVTDVNEPPRAPATPVVSAVAQSAISLTVTWAAPANAGRPAIDSYDVQYRASGATDWIDGPDHSTTTAVTGLVAYTLHAARVTGLIANTEYEARVRAVNDEGNSGWSTPPGAGRTNTLTNNAPVFSPAIVGRSIAENTAADVDIGLPVTATDDDAGDTLGYTLGGAGAEFFDFVEASGQIRTKADVSYDFEARSSYTVTVTASDGTVSAAAIVTISVIDVAEPPDAPATPEVTPVTGSTTSLAVSWAAPDNDGRPAIDGYDVQYRVGGSGTWTDVPQVVTGTTATITGLTAATDYQVQVRAANAEGDSGWSDPPGAGRTHPLTHIAPMFSSSSQTRDIAENTGAGVNVGAAVTATDVNNDPLGYTLGGADAGSFDFVETTGQILTKTGVSYNHEAKPSYTVTVTASDGAATAVATVTINVTDVAEPPDAPATPIVSAVAGSTHSLSVSWTAPANEGRPPIESYSVQWRVSGATVSRAKAVDAPTTTTIISELLADTEYEVRVNATNDEGYSGFSDPPWVGRTSTTLTNNVPVFSSSNVALSIAENTAAGVAIGAAVTATDADAGDTLTYTLRGADAEFFDIVDTTGQIRTKDNVSYDFEAKPAYTVTVRVSDGDATAEASVIISITDVDEAPDAPATPTVSAVADSTTRLTVSWDAPANAGKPDIDSYDVQYRLSGATAWINGPRNVATTTTTVTGLTANTLYEAQVRATNHEGDSGWSDPPGSGRTNSATTNNAPVFSSSNVTRDIAENTAAGRNVGAAVAATDDDGDTLGYTLGGADVAFFDFVETTGQILTKAGVSYDHEAKDSYTVTVTASDGTATAVADVTIGVTDVDEPPSAPATPMVSAVSGSTTRLSVSWAAPANAGKPAIANYDVQYRVGSSGTWSDGPEDVTGTTTTVSGLVADTLYEARVRASNAEGDSGWSEPPGSGRTNTPSNNAPVFDPAMPEREIAENTAAGVDVGAAVTATDADAGDTLSYTLGGADVASFDFVETTGQIRTKAGVSYDHEAKSSYTVTVTATDGTSTADASVTISVTDVDEPPSAPATPMVSAVSGSTTRLTVSWAAPANDGKPAIASYDVQYRVGSSGTWSDGPEDVTGTTTAVSGLVADTLYEARVRATNAEGDSGWSEPPGSGRTNAPTNNAPVFDPAMPEREIAENTAAGVDVGAAVTATDADAGDNLTYMLGGADVASFDFVETTGQIRTKAGVSYDHEAKASYTVTVTATDGTSTADASVTISVTDVDEPPSAPATPMVSAVSGSTTRLTVSWAAPANDGKPAIASYDVQYRVGSSGTWSDGPVDVAGTSTTITSLVANTDYEARVRATNAEGDSGWSDPPGSGRTNAPTTSVPGAPGNLRTAPGDGRMTLTWTAPGNDGGAGIEKYRYRVRADGGSSWDPDWTDVPDGPDTGDSAADETTFTVSGLSNGTEYVFELRAVNSVGEGRAASAADTPVRAPLPPGSGFLVGNFGQRADGASQISVTQDIVGVFTTGARGAELHNIELRLFSRLPDIAQLPSATLYRGSVTDTRATPGTRVATLTAAPGSPRPAASAQTIVFTAPGGTRLDAGATYLVVLEGSGNVRVESTTFPAEDAGGAPGWAIDGIGAGNSSPYSNETTASLLMRVNGTAAGATVATAPEAPASLGARAGDAEVTLRWTPPRSDGGAGIEKYQYRYSAGSRVDPDTAWTDVPDGSDSGTSRADERSVSVTELDNARQYAFELRAVNGVRAGAAATATATPAAARRTGFLVSNFGQPVDGAAQISVTQDIVGAFTAGALGATLDSIELRLYSRQPDIAQRPSATLYRGSVTDTRATAGTRVATLTAAPGSPRPAASAQTIVFTAPGGTRLDAGATYLVVLAGSGYVRVEDTNSSAQDAGGASGWTIDGVGAGNSSPYSYGTSDSLLMSVNGTTARAQREEAAKDEQQEEEQEEEPATSPDPDRGISLSTSSSSAIEGQAATISVRRAGPTDRTTSVAVQVFDSALTGAWPIDLDFRSGVATVTATVAIPFDGARPASRTVTVRLASVEEPYSVGSPSTLTFNVTDRDAALSVDDASVSEGPGATLAFAVTLDRTRDREVRVKYATSDGTATQGEDYTGVSGTLRFAAGETSKTVSVPVLDDAHNEGSETLTLTLSSPRHAVIDDDTAVGTIVNSDPLPDAWLSRFGRAASDQVVQSIGRRLDGGTRESHLTVMGWRVDSLFESSHPERDGRAPRPDAPGWQANGSVRAPDGRIGAAGAMTGATRGVGAMSGPGAARPAFDGAMTQGSAPMQGGSFQSPARAMGGLPANAGGTPGAPGGLRGAPGVVPVAVHAPGAVYAPAARGRGGPWAEMLQGLLMKVGAGGDVRAPGLRDMVMGSSFYYGYSPDAGLLRGMNRLTAWGESASTRFSGAEGKLSLDGEVNTAILGADGEWGRWLAGLALSYSEGEGGYRQVSAKGGAVSSTLSGINPYARYRLDERTSLWATLGYGSGRLTLTPDGAESSLETDMTNAMAAFGGRGVLSMRAGETGQFELALRTDAMLTDTASMAVAGLSAGEGATSRIRLILEGSGSLPAFGGVLAPKVEAGLRYDGGDAETGAGLEVGGGLAYEMARLTVQVDGRVLLTHQDQNYEEWGYSLSFVYQPGEDGRGLRYQAGSQWGAAHSGVQSLWSLQNAGGLANGAPTGNGQRYTAELGYGFGVGRLWYPYVATESGGASSQALRFGLKLNAGSGLDAGLEIGRRAHLSGQIENDIRLQWQARW